jgi:1,2-diacylglycerol 3-beta-galactosyltransferase
VRKLLLLFSDTGGGHRSAGEAVIQALERSHPGQLAIQFVDVLKEYAPPPLNRLPALYPDMVRYPALWRMGYRLSDGRLRARALNRTSWPYIRRAVHRLVNEHSADLVVSFHPLFVAPYLYVQHRPRVPFLVVVTDLVSTHSLWYSVETDLTLVPTEQARERALHNGLAPERVKVTGLPVARRFCEPRGDPRQIRAELGWPEDLPMVLLVGGGEGMGPLLETARALAALDCELGLAVVAGRNARLVDELGSIDWEIPTFIYGFEQRMPQLMRAANLLVTKAGPGTITEAINAHLPMVLYSLLPGQEDGNVDFVINHGLGVWAPGPVQSALAVRRWLRSPDEIAAASQRCAQVARPDAADRIADAIREFLKPPGTGQLGAASRRQVSADREEMPSGGDRQQPF